MIYLELIVLADRVVLASVFLVGMVEKEYVLRYSTH